MKVARILIVFISLLSNTDLWSGPVFEGDAFSTQDMQQISRNSRIFTDLNFTNSTSIFQSNDQAEMQKLYISTFLETHKVAERLKAAQEHEFIFISNPGDNTYTNSPLYNDPTWRRNFYTTIQRSDRILGGPLDDTHPDCVAVGSINGFGGSGTLIASRLVVTAGHCYCGGLTNVILVGTNWNDPSSQIYSVKKAILYPQFDQNTLSNDISLLILQDVVTNVQPRQIATADMIAQSINGYIAGFGRTNADASAGEGTRRCAGPIAFGDASNPLYMAYPYIELVAGSLSSDLGAIGLDTCNGDSGGPLYLRIGDQDYLAGATSRVIGGATTWCGQGGIYVRLDVFLPWIKSEAQSNGIDFN
jgi:hypothetical protein